MQVLGRKWWMQIWR